MCLSFNINDRTREDDFSGNLNSYTLPKKSSLFFNFFSFLNHSCPLIVDVGLLKTNKVEGKILRNSDSKFLVLHPSLGYFYCPTLLRVTS